MLNLAVIIVFVTDLFCVQNIQYLSVSCNKAVKPLSHWNATTLLRLVHELFATISRQLKVNDINTTFKLQSH